MVFSELIFFIFFPAVFAAYFLLPKKYAMGVLFVSSYAFYAGWNYRFLALIFISSVVDFYFARKIFMETSEPRRKMFLAGSIILNLGILGFFKYFNFFLDVVQDVSGAHFSHWEIILPVGISFFTFQSMSYTIDVYRGRIKIEGSFLRFSTYIAFFPQLVAGPIVRAVEFLPQLKNFDNKINMKNINHGAVQFLVGLVKKKAADLVAFSVVDPVFGNIHEYSNESLVRAVVYFSIQIYFDFSGYTDMAIGCARMMNFHLPVNFNYPYLTRSCTEFWRRWHISLSTWLRDYLYISLGGNKKWVYRNLFLTMFLGGIWHGANYTFICWGTFHGVTLMIERFFGLPEKMARRSWTRALYRMITLVLVMYSWLIFRVDSVGGLWEATSGLFTEGFKEGLKVRLDPVCYAVLYGFILHNLYGFVREEFPSFFHRHIRIHWEAWWPLRALIYSFVIILTIVWSSNDVNPFIYFQF